MIEFPRQDPSLPPDKGALEGQSLSPSKPAGEARSLADLKGDIRSWTYEEEIGGVLESFQAGLRLIGPGSPDEEFALYALFVQEAQRVDWSCVVKAEELVLEKLSALAAQGLPANSAEAAAYFELLRRLLAVDNETEDARPRFEEQLAALFGEGAVQRGYRLALEEILEEYESGAIQEEDEEEEED